MISLASCGSTSVRSPHPTVARGACGLYDKREGDLLDQLSLITLLHHVDPHEIYNLAAQSFVPTSWEQPILTSEVTALGATRLLEAIRVVDRSIKFYQASSSEMFGKVRETPQSE